MSQQKRTEMNTSDAGSPMDGNAAYEQSSPLGTIDIGRRSLHLSKAGVAKSCWICGGAVSLESCKADENGHAVHETCYVARVKLSSLR